MIERYERVALQLRLQNPRRFAADRLRLRRREVETDAIRLVEKRYAEPIVVVCARLREQERVLRDTADLTERMLDALPLADGTVLRTMFVEGREDAIPWLLAKLHVSRSQLYRIRDRALDKMAVMMGWDEELVMSN